MTVMPKPIPLTARLNIHINPIVKNNWAIRMVGNPMLASISPEGWFSREIHRPTVQGLEVYVFFQVGKYDSILQRHNIPVAELFFFDSRDMGWRE